MTVGHEVVAGHRRNELCAGSAPAMVPVTQQRRKSKQRQREDNVGDLVSKLSMRRRRAADMNDKFGSARLGIFGLDGIVLSGLRVLLHVSPRFVTGRGLRFRIDHAATWRR